MKDFPQSKTQGQIDRDILLVGFFAMVGKMVLGAVMVAALFAGYILGVQ